MLNFKVLISQEECSLYGFFHTHKEREKIELIFFVRMH